MTNAIETRSTQTVAQEPSRLQRAAKDFESLLLADLLKTCPRRDGLGSDSGSGGLEGYDDLRNEAMASALAEGNGIGIARMLLKQLAPAAAPLEIKAFSSSADHVIAGE